MLLNWYWNRAAVDHLSWLRPFTRAASRKVLFLTIKDEICRAQIFPFFYYASVIAGRGIECRELPVEAFKAGTHPYGHDVDAVCFQTVVGLGESEMQRFVEAIRAAWPAAKIAYLDWFAPAHLPYAKVLTPFVSAYVKKQVLAKFEQYNATTAGDTNLADYFSKRFDLKLLENAFHVPSEFQSKLVLGSGFELSARILRLLRRSPRYERRDIDVHARIAVRGSTWYEHMRREAKQKSCGLMGRFSVVCDGRVSPRKFFAELRRSKLCFSPFGYGEVCWRDFEAMATGALLLKPDMSHLRLASDIFRPYETYVPVAWDLSDLEEKVEHYTRSAQERQSIARCAVEMLQGIYKSRKFISDAEQLWTKLGFS